MIGHIRGVGLGIFLCFHISNNPHTLNHYDYVDYYLPFLFLLVVLVLMRSFSRSWKSSFDRKLFVGAFLLKVVGSAIFLWFYTFYFDSGDTLHYYAGADYLYNTLISNPQEGFDLLTRPANSHTLRDAHETLLLTYFRAEPEWFLCKVAAILGLLCFNSFVTLTFMFSLISYLGTWAIYRVFTERYPSHKKLFAIAILFIPSNLVWTSAILKDSLCIGCIGFMFYAANELLKGKLRVRLIVLMVFAAWLLFNTKAYLGYVFIPCLLIWMVSQSSILYRFKFFYRAFASAVLGLALISMLGGIRTLDFVNDHELFHQSVKKIKGYHTESDLEWRKGDSGYQLDVKEYNAQTMVEYIPIALTTALVRPFLWESNKLLLVFMSIENLIYFSFFIWLLSYRRSYRRWAEFLSNHDLIFCILFTLVLAYILGFTLYNFGLLMRLKTPFLPFLGAGMVIIHHLVSSHSQEPIEQSPPA